MFAFWPARGKTGEFFTRTSSAPSPEGSGNGDFNAFLPCPSASACGGARAIFCRQDSFPVLFLHFSCTFPARPPVEPLSGPPGCSAASAFRPPQAAPASLHKRRRFPRGKVAAGFRPFPAGRGAGRRAPAAHRAMPASWPRVPPAARLPGQVGRVHPG